MVIVLMSQNQLCKGLSGNIVSIELCPHTRIDGQEKKS